MLELLSKIIGPHWAVSVYAFVRTRGVALLAGLAFAGLIATLLLVSSDEEHEHEAFLTVPVLSATAINGDIRNGVITSVRLPDGSATSITSTEWQVAETVTTTACIEKRVYVTSREPRYRLKLPRHCQSS